jgi:hypothetical protein
MAIVNDNSGGEQFTTSILRNFHEMENVRKTYEPLWEDITTLCNQRRDDYLQTDTKGRKRGADSWDGIANRALGIWADGMQGFMVSPSEIWARSRIAALTDEDIVRAWLQEYDKAMMDAFDRGNFYSVIGEFFRDAGSIGTATLYTEEDRIGKRAIHTAIHPGQVFIAEDSLGQVDTVYRKFSMTSRQMIQQFGDVVSNTVKESAKATPQTEFEILHAVFPNKDRMVNSAKSSNKMYRSVYIELGGRGKATYPTNLSASDMRILRDKGFDKLPYAVWRFRKNSDEIYGSSPAADSIITMSKLNMLSKYRIQAAHLGVEPAYNAPEEMRDSVEILPRGMNYYKDPKRVVSPVFANIRYPETAEETERLARLVEDNYRVEFFLLLKYAEREMTATEIMERKAEQATLMGPQRDRLVTDALRPVYELVADIENKAGRLPPPPPIVEDYQEFLRENRRKASIDIEFIGPLAQSQKMLFEAQPIVNTVNAIAPMAEVKPEVLDVLDWDGMTEGIAESYSIPQKYIVSKEIRQQMREARAQAEAQQIAMEQGKIAADAMPKLSKEVEEGSVLDAMAGAA